MCIERKIDLYLKNDDLSELYNKITDNTFCILVDEAQFLSEKQVLILCPTTVLAMQHYKVAQK